jgi:hypothetical protein
MPKLGSELVEDIEPTKNAPSSTTTGLDGLSEYHCAVETLTSPMNSVSPGEPPWPLSSKMPNFQDTPVADCACIRMLVMLQG